MNASEITTLMQRVDACGLSPKECDFLKRAVLTYTAGTTANVARIERAAVMNVVRRHIHTSHFMRVQQHVENDAVARGV